MILANISVARRFVNLATVGPISSVATLARCVDELAFSYHDTPTGEPSEKDHAPPSGIDATRASIAARFPDLGQYGTVFGIELPGEAIVGDAIDDLLDITNDLKKVFWRFDRLGADDAHWHFRMLFQFH
jgi:hypothetical protein